MAYEVGDRRPIAARQHAVFRQAAARLSRAGVSANAISLASVVFASLAAGALVAPNFLPEPAARLAWALAATFIPLRLLCNMLDGMVAVEGGKASPVGELYNEVPDRVSDVAILVACGYAPTGNIALGYIAACVALFTAYVRAMGKVAGGPQEFCGPMAKQQRMVVVAVACAYLALAPAAWRVQWHHYGVLAAALSLIIVLGTVTAARRVMRTARFLRAEAGR